MRATVKPDLEARMRAELPYGLWACEDGREVLFNRGYRPIWQRRPGEVTVPADPAEWVAKVRQSWFYTDRDPPWADQDSRARCEAALTAWGVPVPDLGPIPRRVARAHAAFRQAALITGVAS